MLRIFRSVRSQRTKLPVGRVNITYQVSQFATRKIYFKKMLYSEHTTYQGHLNTFEFRRCVFLIRFNIHKYFQGALFLVSEYLCMSLYIRVNKALKNIEEAYKL